MVFTLNKVFKGFYKDSVALMRLSRDLGAMDGINEAALMMGSPSNKQVLKDAELLSDEGTAAEGGDLILAVSARDVIAARNAADTIEPQIKSQTRVVAGYNVWRPKTIFNPTKSAKSGLAPPRVYKPERAVIRPSCSMVSLVAFFSLQLE